MKRLVIIWSLCLPLFGYSQLKPGKVTDSQSGKGISTVHIQNLSKEVYTVTTLEGDFQLPMELNDSLWLSCVGYKSIGLIVGDKWDSLDHINIFMQPDTILLESLTIYRFPTENQFKQQILDYQPIDSTLSFRGTIPQSDSENPLLLSDQVRSARFALAHPFGFIYHNLSKKRKEVRKAYELEKNKRQHFENQQKYNRELVAAWTGLEDDELTNFMMFCDFSENFLAEKTQFQISEEVKIKYEEFLALRQ